MNIKPQSIIKRIISFILIFCAIILPLGSIFTINASAHSGSALSGAQLNGATVLTDNNKYLSTTSYIPKLDNGYKTSNATVGYALSKNGTGTPFASFYIDTLGEGGSVLKGASKYNGYNAYGFVAGSGEAIYGSDSNSNDVVGYKSIAIKLKYNYSSNKNLTGTDGYVWNISNDSHKSAINGITGVGLVGKGAVIVQKFVPGEGKSAPTKQSDWKRLNEFSGNETYGVHTVNFFGEYSPESHQTPFTLYTPLGEDLKKGVYIKITVAYELVRTETYNKFLWFKGERQVYKNVVEETVFYLCNTSAELVFKNLYFGDGSTTESSTGNSTTTTEQKGGEITDKQGAIEGFRVDMRGCNYNVTYHYNHSTNALPCKDGQVFLEPGKYDFIIRTKIGVVRTKTVYIHEKTNKKNIETYFGDGLISADSVRIFAPSETYPVYVKDTVTLQTKNENVDLVKHAPLVGKVYLLDDDWESVKRDANGMPLIDPIAQKKATDTNWSFSDLPSGMYEAIFVNNEDYFADTDTGDTYKFVWRFTIVEEGQAPVVNEELLYQQLGFSDYESKHFVVRLSTKGTGSLLVVFTDENSAYDFACRYLVSTVSVDGETYIFDGVSYKNEAEMLTELRKKAEDMVEKRYYDATDVNTYLTLKESIVAPFLSDNPTKEEKAEYDAFVGVLDREFNYDILVFLTEDSREDAAIGEPYLNDRIFAYIDENGEIKVENRPIYFISVADFESSSVTLILEGTDISYNIPYGVPVQAFLEKKNAPTGRYKIQESNPSGTTEYYAVYIRPSSNSGEVTVERVYNNNSITQTISKINAGTRLRANNFKIVDIYNEFDPYGLIKIKKSDGETLVYQIDEYENIPIIDEEGNYEIILVDRLGNSFSFFVDIYTAKKVYTFSLTDGSETLLSSSAYGGKEFVLPTLSSDNEKLEFYGWEDEDGNIYNDVYTFNSPKSVTLKAVWHYSSVRIDVYDGEKIADYTCKVGDLQTLPKPERDGYVLYGYRHVLDDGTIRFYRGQISSVPNYEHIRLDSVWKKEESLSAVLATGEGNMVKLSLVDGDLHSTLTLQKGETIALPTLEATDGMKFFGWLYENGLSGLIFTDKFSYNDVAAIGLTEENAVKLVAVWLASSDEHSASNLLGGGTTSGGGGIAAVIGGESKALSTETTVGIITAFTALLLLIAFAFRKKIITAVGFAFEKTKERASQRTFTVGRLYRKVLVPCICAILSFVTLYFAGYETVAYATCEIVDAAEEAKEQKAAEEATKQRNEQLAGALVSVQSTLSADSSDLDESEEFLYSNIIVDLLSMGYQDVFTAYAIVGGNTPETDDDKIIDGIGYTAYVDAYEENGEHIFGAGFVSLVGDNGLTKEDIESGVIVQVVEDEAVDYEYSEFKLTANQVWGPLHYVAYDKYVQYQVFDYAVQYTVADDNGKYVDALGDVYNYDIGEYCHYSDYGEPLDLDVYGITSDMDYDEILQIFRESIESQMQNGIEVTVEKADFISIQAINDYIAYNQDERFLGVDVDTLLYYESNIDDTMYYIVYEDGSVGVLNLPPDPERKANVWERIAMGVASVGAAVIGVVCCAIPGVGPVLGGAIISAALDVFMQTVVMGTTPKNIDWVSVGTSAVIGALTGGIGAGAQAAASSAVKAIGKNVVAKFFAGLGIETAAGMFSGAVTYLVGAAARGEKLSFEECVKSMALGAATGAIIFAGGQALAAVAGKVGIKNIANFAKSPAGIIITGSLSGFATYMTAIALTGEEFSVEGLLLAIGMGAATATLVVIGGKIVKTVKSAQAKRLEKSNNKTYNNYSKRENGVTNYYDDNGKLYRVGNELSPNSEYTINGYTYTTDDQGRISDVSGSLYLKNGDRSGIKDSMKKIGKGYQKPTDHRGHLIGDRFNGGNGLENIVAQDGGLNKGDYFKLEHQWAEAIKSGKNVSVKIDIIYTDASSRPFAFEINYEIDGVELSASFRN